MEKNKNAIQNAIFIIIGVFVGWLIWGSVGVGGDAHMMHDEDHMSDMQHMMDDMSAGLVGKIGDDFDKAFIDEMIVHHQGAIDMAEMVLETSTRPELIKLANDIIAAQTNEIEMMSSWRAEWFTN